MYIKNTVRLISIQLVNYLGPLIALPLLTTGFDATDFGVFAFYIAIYNFLLVFSDMGVANTAPRLLAVRNKAGQVSEFFSVAIAIRILAFTFLFLTACICLKYFFEQKYNIKYLLIIYIVGIPLAFNINQFAILKGDIEIVLKTSLEAKFLYLIFISLQAFIGFNLLWSIGVYVFCNALQYVRAYNKFCIKNNYEIKKFNLLKLKLYIKKIGLLSSANVIVWVYTSSPIFLIEKMYGAEAVGMYGAAERIMNAIKSLFAPLQQLIQIKVIRSTHRDLSLHYKMLLFLMIIGGVAAVIIVASASDVVELLAGAKYNQASTILMAMAGLPILFSVSGYMGNCILLLKGESKLYFKSLVLGFFVYIGGIFVINIFGLDVSIFVGLQSLVEIMVCFSMMSYFLKK